VFEAPDFPGPVEQLELGIGRNEPNWHASLGFPAIPLLGLALTSLIDTFTL
jgi:hypothetical protein